MPRQKVYFGPYILLQTLGEGEFGKVKLGLHSERWGEEVAIKLIKRGSVDTAQRSEKVKREIDVLKTARHPNIVSLYDVIETDKYIGIVLEFCSGGELFDHILAHRYLREKDATRLFSQLVSGVAYLHAKGIVHRDLKLENLLLERGFLKITDFGFANRFELAASDLMATSCGSPCYAAPELVVQEGKYVGTAVDVWSCGVILYAMLAGYLPYDDDPANPEGDNINLLYKYILSTPLTFPDWITPEPRDLLLRMLVPDPAHRATVDDVTRHPWLRKHAAIFFKTVPELEAQAHEAEVHKRAALEAQRQFLVQQQQQQQQQQNHALLSQSVSSGAQHPHQLHHFRPPQGPPMTRSQTTQLDAQTAAQRHRSAVVTSSSSASAYRNAVEMPPSVPEESRASLASLTPPAPPPPVATTQVQAVSVSATTVPSHYTAPPPTSVPMVPSFSAPPDPPAAGEDQIMDEGDKRGESRRRQGDAAAVVAAVSPRTRRSSTRSGGATTPANVSDSEKRKKSHRATVQVEYDGGDARQATATATAGQGMEKRVAPAPIVTTTTAPVVVDPEPAPAPATAVDEEDVVMTPVEMESDAVPAPLSSDSVVTAVDAPAAAPATAAATASPPTPPLVPVPLSFPATPPPRTPAPHTSTPQKRKNSGSPAVTADSPDLASRPEPSTAAAVPPPSLPTTVTTPATPVAVARPPVPPEPVRAPSVASTTSRHRKGGMSTDRFSIRSFLGASTSSLERSNSVRSAKAKADVTAAAAAAEAKRVAQAQAAEKQKALDEVTNNRRKSRRQKALSLQPFRPSTASRVTKVLKADPAVPTLSEGPRTRSSTAGATVPKDLAHQRKEGSMAPPPRPSTAAASSKPAVPPRSTSVLMAAEHDWSSAQTGGSPSGKAKAVMDWFRRRGAKGNETPFSTDFDRRRTTRLSVSRPEPPSTSASDREGSTTPVASSSSMRRGPSVVVTSSPADESPNPGQHSVPSSRSASGATSDVSHFSQATVSTTATTVSMPLTPGPVIITPAVAPPRTAVSAFSESRLRIHNGALDKSALFMKKTPDEVMVEVRNALWAMGIEMIPDGDYKIKCIRQSRKKTLASGTGLGVSIGSSQSNVSAGSAASGQVDRRSGLPSSPSLASALATSPSTGFRSFFGRKGSTTPLVTPSPLQSSPSAFPSPALSSSHDEMDLLGSPLVPSSSTFSASPALSQPVPTYGDSNSTDQGDEVRFNCEITRVKNLPGLYYVDVKRLKGSPWSYKHIYDDLLDKVELGGT